MPPHRGMFAAPPPPPPLGAATSKKHSSAPARTPEPPSPRTVARALSKGKEVREYVDLDDKGTMAKEIAKTSNEEHSKTNRSAKKTDKVSEVIDDDLEEEVAKLKSAA